MAKRQKQIDSQNHTVRTLQNDYVRSTNNKAILSKKQKVLFRRRMFIFSVFALVVIGFLINTILSQNERLANKQEEKEKVMEELQEVKEQQEALNLQIKKLEDDEYIAKLARKEYFLSDDGEIIFTIPNESSQENKEK